MNRDVWEDAGTMAALLIVGAGFWLALDWVLGWLR